MRVTQRFSYNGWYVHQTVDGIGTDLEIQEYGAGVQDGEHGVFGVVHPTIDNMKKTGLDKGVLVINIGGKWVQTTEEDECHLCHKTLPVRELQMVNFRRICKSCKGGN